MCQLPNSRLGAHRTKRGGKIDAETRPCAIVDQSGMLSCITDLRTGK
jgi:hypothetical protein